MYTWSSDHVLPLGFGLGCRGNSLGIELQSMCHLSRSKKETWRYESERIYDYERTKPLLKDQRQLRRSVERGGPNAEILRERLQELDTYLQGKTTVRPRPSSCAHTVEVMRLIRPKIIPDHVWQVFISVNLVQAKGARGPYPAVMTCFYRAWISKSSPYSNRKKICENILITSLSRSSKNSACDIGLLATPRGNK